MGATSTRDRILDAALRLFNEEGVARVSTNRIADEAGISPGNLYYHFRSRAQIVEWLDRRFELRLEPLLRGTAAIDALDDFWLTLHLTFEAIHDYRFLALDTGMLLRESPAFAARARRRTARLLESMRGLLARFAAAGTVRATSADVELLAFHITFTTTCWSAFERLMPGERAPRSESGLAAYYVLTLVTPYLEDDARQYVNYLRSKYLR